MKGTYTLQHLAQYKQQSSEQNVSLMHLSRQARAGQPAAWSRAIEKAAVSLIKAGSGLQAKLNHVARLNA